MLAFPSRPLRLQSVYQEGDHPGACQGDRGRESGRRGGCWLYAGRLGPWTTHGSRERRTGCIRRRSTGFDSTAWSHARYARGRRSPRPGRLLSSHVRRGEPARKSRYRYIAAQYLECGCTAEFLRRNTPDRKPDRAFHVAFRRSEQPHADIVRIDATKARAAPGVVAVFTADDVAADYKPVIPFSRMPNYYATEITALASKKVRYVGEAVVAVVAEDRYLAEDAVELIDIEYALLGAVSDAEFAVSKDAPLLHAEAATNVLIAREFRKGDAAADLAAAHVRVRDRFEMTRKAPLAIEPRSYCAEFESRRDSITLYTSSNIPGIVRDALAESLDLPGSRLRVVAPDVGGSFGSKGSLYPEEILLCVAAKKLRRSLKWTADRLEDISSSSQAFAEIVDAEMGFDENGSAIALEADVIGDVGAYSIYPWTCGLEPVQVVSFLPGPYKIRSYRGAVRGVATNKPPTGPYRGVGRPVSTFVTERLMDMGAKALGIDPLEIRRRNLVRADEFPYRIASGIIWDRTGFVECLEAAVQAGEYEKLRKQQSAARAEGRYFGIGLATYAELMGIGSQIAVAPGMPINTGSETAKIRIDSTGAITAAFGVASHGQGLETTLAQIIADDLGARFGDIRVV